MLLDHLILGVPDLDAGCAAVTELLGIEPVAGGRHRGRGTANALVRLGETAYLEVLGPDPEGADDHARWLTSGWVGQGRLVGWAVRSVDIEGDVARLRRAGWDPGPITRMGRDGPAGPLEWRLTPSHLETGVATLPFLIDWSGTSHPASALPPGVELGTVTLGHPRPEKVASVISMLEVDVRVEPSPSPRLSAELVVSSRTMTLEALSDTPQRRRTWRSRRSPLG